MNRSIVTKSPIDFVQYQLKLVREIQRGKPITYAGYAPIKKKGPRQTILAGGILGEVQSYKGALSLAQSYMLRRPEGRLPAPWEEIEGAVLTRHHAYGKVESTAFTRGGILRGAPVRKKTHRCGCGT
jgi:hypothetical protein